MENENLLNSLYGTCIAPRHCIGYCKHHCAYITPQQLKTKECLRKQCRALERHEHIFWKKREFKKMIKKQQRSGV